VEEVVPRSGLRAAVVLERGLEQGVLVPEGGVEARAAEAELVDEVRPPS